MRPRAASGLLIVVGYHLFLNVGTRYTTSGVAALVVALSPGMTLLLALALVWIEFVHVTSSGLPSRSRGCGRRRPGHRAVRLRRERQGTAHRSRRALAFALYNVILKPLLGRHDLLALTAATSLIGIVGLAPLVRASTVDALVDASAGDLALILYLGVLATFLGYIGWNVGLRGLGPTRAVAYTYAISPLAVLIGAVVLGEELSLWLVLGAVLVVGGIALAQRAPRRGRSASVESWRSASSPSES